MDKKDLAQAVIEAQSACPEFKEAAKNYIDAIGTEREAEAGKILLAEAQEDINSIDDTIAFFESEMAAKIFGAAIAAEKLASAKQAKANGAKYCNCPGCAAAEAIIDNKEIF
jgi:hypothetical protein